MLILSPERTRCLTRQKEGEETSIGLAFISQVCLIGVRNYDASGFAYNAEVGVARTHMHTVPGFLQHAKNACHVTERSAQADR